MRTAILLSFALIGHVACAAPSGPRISNREPARDEVGYRPADGSTNALNPPSFIWLHEKEAKAYTVQWARDRELRFGAAQADTPWNTYTHDAVLSPGTYYWRYRFTDGKGGTSDWSAVRSVTIPQGAVAFPMPGRAEQRQRVPEGHPRLFLRPEDLPKLRELCRGAQAGEFKRLAAAADKYIAAGPTPEPEKMGSARDKKDKEAVSNWWPNRERAEKASAEAMTIAFVYMITGEAKYKEAARKWVLHLAAWDPDGPTNFGLNCEAGKVMLYRPWRAYDWAWDAFSPAERATIGKVVARRAADAWKSGEISGGTGHLTKPYSSHGNRVWHKLAEAAIAFLGEVPEAEMWLDYAVNKFYSAYPVWSDDDGGWHEGLSYWAGYMGKVTSWLQVSRAALGIDGYKKPFFSHVGDYALYVAPPGSPNQGFGDLSYRPPSSGVGVMMDWFIRGKGARPDGGNAAYWRWWVETWKMARPEGIEGILAAARLPEPPAAKAPGDLPQSKVFRGIGVASLHDTLKDARQDVHFLMKSSPFGSQSHGHNPQNTYQLTAYGEELLMTCVYRDLHGSDFHYKWAHSTRAHNAVLVDGEGQVPHSAGVGGRISEFVAGDGFDYAVGDAVEAYGGRLERFLRRVTFVKPDLIVICDDLAAKKPATFQFMLHGLKEFAVDEKGATVSLERTKAGVGVAYLSPVPMKFRQWDGYDPPPDKEFPNQWHVEAGTTKPLAELEMLTVIVPYRAGQHTPWATGRVETAREVGVKFQRGEKTVTVMFPRRGATGPAKITGL